MTYAQGLSLDLNLKERKPERLEHNEQKKKFTKKKLEREAETRKYMDFLAMVRTLDFFFLFLINLFIYLFIFGCFGSSLLRAGFLQLRRAGATLHCGARASHCSGFSCCGAGALGAQASVVVARGLSSCGTRAQLLRNTWDLPGPGLKPVSTALAGGFLTTVPPGKHQDFGFYTNCISNPLECAKQGRDSEHGFNKYSLMTYYMPGTSQSLVNMPGMVSAHMELTF